MKDNKKFLECMSNVAYLISFSLRLRLLNRISEKEASAMLRQVAEALHALHSKGLCHNDLKPYAYAYPFLSRLH